MEFIKNTICEANTCITMNSINFVVLGEQTIANDFGKKGTSTDLTLYDKKESDVIRTWVTPNGFPEKIQPLLQAINIAEYVIFYIASLDKYVGEQIIALDMLGKKDGIISHSYEVDENRLNSMIKGTVLNNYKKVDFWNELDYIGVDAYFPFSKKKKPKLNKLVTSWEKQGEKL